MFAKRRKRSAKEGSSDLEGPALATTTTTLLKKRKAPAQQKQQEEQTTTKTRRTNNKPQQPQQPRKPQQQKQQKQQEGSQPAKHQIFVRRIGELSEQELKEYFTSYGPVQSVVLVKDPSPSSLSSGCAFVTFEEETGRVNALKAKHNEAIECWLSDKMDQEGWECFVGGLPKDLDGDALQNHFRRFGSVVGARIMIDENSKLSRGFGFVQFASANNIAKVLSASILIGGVAVSTKLAEPPRAKKQSLVASHNSLFIGGLPKHVAEEELRQACGAFGAVQDVLVKVDEVTGNCRGFAFVSFAKRKGFTKCLAAGTEGKLELGGRKLSARPAKSKSSKDSYHPKDKKDKQQEEQQ